MVRRDEVDRLREDGYVVVPEVLSAESLRAIREQLAPHLQGVSGTQRVRGSGQRAGLRASRQGAGGGRVGRASADVAAVDEVLEPNYILSARLAILLHPGETAQDWHHDDAFLTLPRQRPAHAASTIWAIGDFTADNGATELVPGSHRWGGEPPAGAFDAAIVAEMPAGSVLVFLGTTVHRAAPIGRGVTGWR